MDCPRCGTTGISGPECPACGVILARARPPRPPFRPPSPRPDGEAPRTRRSLRTFVLVGLAAAVGATMLVRRPSPAPDPAAPGTTDAPETAGDWAAGDEPEGWSEGEPGSWPGDEDADPMAEAPVFEVPAIEPEPLTNDTSPADRSTAARLAALLDAGAPVGRAEVQVAEDLYSRYGDAALTLLEAVLVKAARGEQAARRYAEAEALLRRASGVAPHSLHPVRGLLSVRLEAGDWRAAEDAARAALSLSPSDHEATRGLAYALLRQNRSPEAIEALEASLDASEDPASRALLEKLRRDSVGESGLTEQRLAHFHVRYDGDAHEDVGRAVLRVLDRHYATLVRRFDYQPPEPIPVILLSRQGYEDVTGAPGWSGGLYDSFDGRVRIPIAGLTPSLDPELDDALLHELTHAFVADRTRGVAPREIHEGLAQLMEGKTTDGVLGEAGLRALADGRLRGVAGFYAAALSLVEHLVGQRGQGGINDLLAAMAETGNADAAFRSVYGKDFAGIRREWQARLRQRYGS